jgi:iron(II)-dependent oxidoreductase
MARTVLAAAATGADLAAMVADARQRLFDLVSDLSDEALMGPKLSIVNPLLWEIGHVGWFQEKWVLRHAGGRSPLRRDGDSLWDSIAIAHDTRWDLPLPSRRDTFRYLEDVRDQLLDLLAKGEPTAEERYFLLLSIFHEDMHTEAFTYTRQTLSHPKPRFTGVPSAGPSRPESDVSRAGALPGDVEVPGGTFLLGASKEEPFVFDNEKWEHRVEVPPFRIARAPVTQLEFAAFVEDEGYRRRELWSPSGWAWRSAAEAQHPVYWRREGNSWMRRNFDQWVKLEPDRPVLHVSWWEAEAYCRWARRRLPAEAEWEVAAASPAPRAHGNAPKRRFPWGDEAPERARANLDWNAMGCVDVAAHPQGDSAFGCRQMIGNVWEWTQDDFQPFPGFVPDPYKEYSQPMFGKAKVLRGGCWATRSRLIRNSWRNFYGPDRRDVWAGFRTCALPA